MGLVLNLKQIQAILTEGFTSCLKCCHFQLILSYYTCVDSSWLSEHGFSILNASPKITSILFNSTLAHLFFLPEHSASMSREKAPFSFPSFLLQYISKINTNKYPYPLHSLHLQKITRGNFGQGPVQGISFEILLNQIKLPK